MTLNDNLLVSVACKYINMEKTKLELITNLIKATLWPLVIILIIIFLGKPLRKLIDNSQSISFGNFTLRIKNEVSSPSQNVKNVISKISGKEINELLYIGIDTTEYTGYDDESLKDAPIEQLIDNGLIKSVTSPTLDTLKHFYKPTPLGVETYNFYVDLISAFAKNISEEDLNKK